MIKLAIVVERLGADWPIIELRIRTRLEVDSFVAAVKRISMEMVIIY